jgi:hypothetical protein
MGSDLFSNDGDLPLQTTLEGAGNSAGGGVHLKLNPADVLTLSDESHTLYVFGGAGDSLDAGGGWSAAGQETVDGAVFNVYTQGEAVLKVDCDIDQSLIGLA